MKSSWRCWVFAIALGELIAIVTASYLTDQEGNFGPFISPNKNEIVLQKGQNFTLKCKGKRQLHIKQQDIPEESLEIFHMEERNLKSTDIENPFEVALDLYNVDQYAVGYYACFDDTVDSKAILNDFMDEPNNTEHVTYTYIYVNGTDVLFAPLSEYFTPVNGLKSILRCRPTMPDTEITLSLVPQSHKTPEFIKYSPKIGFLIKAHRPSYQCNGRRGNQTSWKLIKEVRWTPPIEISASRYFMAGESFTINCSVKYQPNSAIALSWIFPEKVNQMKVVSDSNELNVTSGQNLYNAIKVKNATKEDAGVYICRLNSGPNIENTKNVEKEYLEHSFINLTKSSNDRSIETDVKQIKLKVEVKAYPQPKPYIYRNNEMISTNNSKYKVNIHTHTGDIVLSIYNLSVYDTANYTIVADNGYKRENVTYDLRKRAAPSVDFGPNADKICLVDSKISLLCEVVGYPLPSIEWIFSNEYYDVTKQGNDTKKSEYKIQSILEITASTTGNITCQASNKKGKTHVTRQLLIDEISNGFGITNKDEWYPENHEVLLRCLASKYKFDNCTWLGPNGGELAEYVQYSQSNFSHVAYLKINQVSVNQAGTYKCVGTYINGTEEVEFADIFVKAALDPVIIEPAMDRNEEVTTYQPVEFSCVADGVPIPTIEWLKDGELVLNDTDGLLILNYQNHTVVNSTIVIERMKDVNKGKYECLATSEGIWKRKFVTLVMKDSSISSGPLLGSIAAIILALLVLVIYLTWKIRKEKRFRKELAAAGLLYFKEGVTKSLNPDLGIDEQAELLPYDEEFEFPPEKLILGKQLGAGAFGVVYKAEARGIINAEETTPVAVKMVKKTADNMYIKALASELKIMVHLGKHINIVNLLGACTKNVGKRELIVIVEYCKFGNIHNYMQKHREVFIDQLTDNKEKNLGRVNKGYSCSSASSGVNSDYFGTNHTQATDHTFVNTGNTNQSGRKDKQNQQEEFAKVSETGYVQPEWRSNYESDYSFDGRNPRPLTSRDLLAWAFQIARGMEYLASRKVLHGDLAARNVLLAEDSIVKICDFGLARSIYKNDEYQKKENSLLPVKWLAVECMTDRIFSTQSDVWSFGIVLWEMFSLAKTPYPNMSPQHLLPWLEKGNRLEKPTYADDRLYDVMMRCWEHKPTARPSFSQLQELLGSFLEENVRNHYVDLNSVYMSTNVRNDDQEDYLAMVSAPDYNNLVTPSPHHYMNDGARSFFPPSPTQVPLDEEGYLQMTPANPSIFSPRNQSTKFDFDARKLDPRVSDVRSGSELTPMLTLNNLPARSGSDSDHEGGHSPYLNMIPRIAEEPNDVFTPTSNNFKNIQNSAVTNPTYITIGIDAEKKSKDINHYLNIPNGLVK